MESEILDQDLLNLSWSLPHVKEVCVEDICVGVTVYNLHDITPAVNSWSVLNVLINLQVLSCNKPNKL